MSLRVNIGPPAGRTEGHTADEEATPRSKDEGSQEVVESIVPGEGSLRVSDCPTHFNVKTTCTAWGVSGTIPEPLHPPH